MTLLLDTLKVLEPTLVAHLPSKRSGFSYVVFVLYQACIQLMGLSPRKTGELLNQACLTAQICFQPYQKAAFANGKTRRFFPDQPALSRCLKKLHAQGCTETFWNAVNFAHLLLLKHLHIVNQDLKLIADYNKQPCPKKKEDPYCFGSKEGKTYHKTLTFSVISTDLHQVIANFKIYKRQDKLPIFEQILDRLQKAEFHVKYALLDREFYRTRLLKVLKQWHVTVIMPARKCALTAQKITAYLKKLGKRFCKGFTKLKYVKGQGYPLLRFDLLLGAKRSYHLKDVRQDFNAGKITLKQASGRIFPLIVMIANATGITTLHGNEVYIRDLYRSRWLIEIAFREMNKLGITTRMQQRDARLGVMGVRSFVYNLWQVQRYLHRRKSPAAAPLELDEFLGKTHSPRSANYLTPVSST